MIMLVLLLLTMMNMMFNLSVIITRFIAPYLKQVLCQQLKVSLRKPHHVNFVETSAVRQCKTILGSCKQVSEVYIITRTFESVKCKLCLN